MHLPPRRTATVLGETLEYVQAGAGPSPAVVLVNGAGGPIEAWHKVFGPLAALAPVLAYNRAGIGRSSRPAVPQRASHLVASLRGLLAAAHLVPPFLLVGHSLGGLVVNLFARLHPQDVAGVVLVEATAPDDVAAMAAHEGRLQGWLRRALDRLSPPDPLGETALAPQSVAELRAAPAFPPVPLRVLTGARPAMAWATPPAALAARADHQRALAGLSPLGRQVVAPRSGHFPQFSEPALVVDTIRELLGAQLAQPLKTR